MTATASQCTCGTSSSDPAIPFASAAVITPCEPYCAPARAAFFNAYEEESGEVTRNHQQEHDSSSTKASSTALWPFPKPRQVFRFPFDRH